MARMPVEELGIALMILRIVRGWTQEELARTAGLPNSSVSDYERGRKVPVLKNLNRLLSAMGYPLSALEQAQRFASSLRSGQARAGDEPAVTASGEPPAEQRDALGALQWEIEQVAEDAGRVATRAVRLVLNLAGRTGQIETSVPVDIGP